MIRIVALTASGKNLARRLQGRLPGSSVWYKPKPFAQTIQQAFSQGEALIFICAIAIAVRTLVPVISNKLEDPPVLVLDDLGRFVIPLLSGHAGGANHWANEIAHLLSAQLVLTTAKHYLKPVYTIGMGCVRCCEKDELYALLRHCLQLADLNMYKIASINSIDIKADEQGLIRLANSLKRPFQTWNRRQLGAVAPLLSAQSDYVYAKVGVYAVAESAALFAAQKMTGTVPELVLNKQKTHKATCAIARSYPTESEIDDDQLAKVKT